MSKEFYSAIQYDDLKDFIKPIRIFGNPVKFITFPAPLETAQSNNITFCRLKGDRALSLISRSKAGIIICHDDIPNLEITEFVNCIFTVPNPRLSFMKLLQKFFTSEKPVGIHPTAIIEKEVVLPENVYIGPMVHLCSNVKIGEGTVIEDRVYIAPNATIGRNVYIQVGAVIGCEGQGFERNDAGEFEKFPQFGSVILEDEVEIGANSTIVRGTFSETVIGYGSKIGHLVDIGHNVRVGKHVFISAGAVVCGSAVIGDYSWLAPRCCIRNKVVIGKHVTVGLGALVLNDVEEGFTVVGVPAKPIKEFKK